jgi:hypothetical protein
MPQRSNEFQKLIRALETQLAPAGATVEESALLVDAHGTEREVDVLIRIPAGERELRIGIECRDEKRRGDLPWLEQVKSKYESLSVDRCVVVSRRGFSKTALARARLWNIETLSLGRAKTGDWADRLTRIVRLEVREELYSLDPTARLRIKRTSENDLPAIPDAGRAVLCHASGLRETVKDYIDRTLAQKEVFDAIRKVSGSQTPPPGADAGAGMRFTLQDGCMLVDNSGRAWEVESIELGMRRSDKKRSVALDHGRYGNAAVAIGAGLVADAPMSVAYSQRQGMDPKGSLTIHWKAGEETVDLPEPFPDPYDPSPHGSSVLELPPRRL